MPGIQNPSQLSLKQVYSQARSVARHTSRARNPDWYRPGLELDRQWHILSDGRGEPRSYVYDRRRGLWEEGPPISKDILLGNGGDDIFRRQVADLISRIVDDNKLGGRCRSLGVVVHLADELAIADLSPEYSLAEDYGQIRAELKSDPRRVIADSTLDLDRHYCKLLPQWGQRQGDRRSVAMVLSRKTDRFLLEAERIGEERNLPVICHLLSSPLATLLLVPLFLCASSPGGDILLLQYTRLTTLVVLDESGELLQLRVLPHRQNADFPASIEEAVANAAASMNLNSPTVHVLSLGEVDSQGLIDQLAQSPLSGAFEVRAMVPLAAHLGIVPAGRIELLVANAVPLATSFDESALSRSQTFQELSRGWALQNFTDGAQERNALFPSRKELLTLNLVGKAKITFTALALSLAGYAGYEGAMISRMGIGLNQVELNAKRMELANLIAEEKRISYWESMMIPRSEAWSAMELILRMIPEDGSILLTSCNYSAAGEPPRNQAVKTISYKRIWRLKGYCRQTGRLALNQLGSNGYIGGLFRGVATDFSREAFRTDAKDRPLVVTMQQDQGEFPPNGILEPNVARLYNTRFEITITQNVSERDELAILISPPEAGKEEGGRL